MLTYTYCSPVLFWSRVIAGVTVVFRNSVRYLAFTLEQTIH